jgi:hypothetical protein
LRRHRRVHPLRQRLPQWSLRKPSRNIQVRVLFGIFIVKYFHYISPIIGIIYTIFI